MNQRRWIIRTTNLDQQGFSILESVITMALVLVIAYFVFPIFARISTQQKASSFKEQCQRVVNTKIAFYNGLSRDQLIERYNRYRSVGAGGTSASTHPLCGNPNFGNPVPTPSESYRAKIASFIQENGIYKYGRSPELGLRECVELSQYPVLDIQSTEVAGKPYPPNFCLTLGTTPTTHRKSDLEVMSEIIGMKAYVRMRIVGSWDNTVPWKCPAALDPFESYLGSSIDIQVSVASDYLSVGQTSSGGVVDPNRLICSASTSISLMKEKGPLTFRFYSSLSSSGTRSIHRVSDGWKLDAPEVHRDLAYAMNHTKFDGTLLPSQGVVTQFGIDPGGTYGFFLKAFENNPDPVMPLTTFLCSMEQLKENESSPTSIPHHCRILPRVPGNQIEYILMDWSKGKMWGISGRKAYPNRVASPPDHQIISESYLLADCSGTEESMRVKALLFGTPTCVSSDSGNQYPMPTVVPLYPGNTTVTDESFSVHRKLDSVFLNVPLPNIYSPDVTPAPGSPSKANHLDARALRSIPNLFSLTQSPLFTVSTNPPRDCGLSGKCLSQAYARLFFSPDALTAYALIRYPYVAGDPGCMQSTAGDSASVARLELANPAGATQSAILCPETVMNLKTGQGGVEVLPDLISY